MKKIIVSVAVMTLAVGGALAADLSSRKAELLLPPPPPPPKWMGFYAGLNAGGTWGNSNTAQWTTYPVYLNPNSAGAAANAQAFAVGGSPQLSLGSQLGFLGGGQVGYNYQVSKNILVGIEADIQGAAGTTGNGQGFQAVDFSFTSTRTGRPVPTTLYAVHSIQKSLDYLGTVRGKIGYLLLPTLQVYGTGGFAYGGVTLNSFAWQANSDAIADDVGPGGSGASSMSVGWTAGGGVEWMFAPSWSVKAEYLYYDLGTRNHFAGSLAAVWSGVVPVRTISAGDYVLLMSTNVSARLNGNIARVGVNYHFNWGGSAPVIASY